MEAGRLFLKGGEVLGADGDGFPLDGVFPDGLSLPILLARTGDDTVDFVLVGVNEVQQPAGEEGPDLLGGDCFMQVVGGAVAGEAMRGEEV